MSDGHTQCPKCGGGSDVYKSFRLGGNDAHSCSKCGYKDYESEASTRLSTPASEKQIKAGRVADLSAKQKKYRESLFYLGVCLLTRISLLFTDCFELEPSIQLDLQTAANWVSFVSLFSLFFALTRLWSLAWLIYPRKKAVAIIACSLLAVTFPFVAYIVYRDTKRIMQEGREAKDYVDQLAHKHGLLNKIAPLTESIWMQGSHMEQKQHERNRVGILCLIIGVPLAIGGGLGAIFDSDVSMGVGALFGILLCVGGFVAIKSKL